MPTPDLYALAREYNAQRNTAFAVYADKGHGPEHNEALVLLNERGRALHTAERREGVPIGSTRQALHAQALTERCPTPDPMCDCIEN